MPQAGKQAGRQGYAHQQLSSDLDLADYRLDLAPPPLLEQIAKESAEGRRCVQGSNAHHQPLAGRCEGGSRLTDLICCASS
jgi:hypothetical protein